MRGLTTFSGLRRLLPIGLGVAALLSMVACAGQPVGNPDHMGSMVLVSHDDAHVTTDASKQDDPDGLRDKNYGNLDFMAVSYADKLSASEQLVVVGLSKFNTTPLKDFPVLSATLQLYALRTDLAQPARLVDVTIADGDWNEGEVNFNNKPNWVGNPIATTALYGGGLWYSWDVTPTVSRLKGGDITYVLGLRTVQEKTGEQVLFATHEAGVAVAPRLLVTYAIPDAVVPVWSLPAAIAAAIVLVVAAFFLISRARSRKAAPALRTDPGTAAI